MKKKKILVGALGTCVIVVGLFFTVKEFTTKDTVYADTQENEIVDEDVSQYEVEDATEEAFDTYSTDELLTLAINHTNMVDFLAFDDPADGIAALVGKYDVFAALMNRTDAVDVICQAYDAFNDSGIVRVEESEMAFAEKECYIAMVRYLKNNVEYTSEQEQKIDEVLSTI